MQKRTKENGITILSLVITIIVLGILAGVSIQGLIGDNGIIKGAKQTKENYELAQEEEKDNMNSLYVELVTQLGSIEEDNENEESETTEGIGTATSEQILAGYTAYQGGQLVTGSMTNRGAVMKELSAGESYTIPKGYHNGSGVITAKDLASQTTATATADDILVGATAWVNGTLLEGTNKGYDAGYSDASSAGSTLTVLSEDASYTTEEDIANLIVYASYHATDYNSFGGYVNIECSSYENLTVLKEFTSSSYQGNVYGGNAAKIYYYRNVPMGSTITITGNWKFNGLIFSF